MADSQTGSPTDQDQAPDPTEVAFELVTHHGQLQGHTIYTAADLGVFEYLRDGPATGAAVATDLDLDPHHTDRLLRALASYDVLTHHNDDRFSLTPTGERFQADHDESIRDFLLFFYDPARLAAIRHFPTIVETGDDTGYHLEYGMGIFDYCENNPEFARRFNGFQDISSLGPTQELLDTLADYDFSRFETICDVGGGYGDLLCHILLDTPSVDGKVLELPSVLADEDRLWASKLGVDDRCEYIAGDMFESVPTADAYFMRAILHDWPDEDCITILSNIYDAAPEDAHLLVRERVLPPDPSPESTTMDMWMLLETGGRERTRAEFESLFEATGWALSETYGFDGELQVLEAIKD